MHEKNDRKESFTSGFTIIELLVSIVIMTVLFSVGVVNYRSVSRNKALDAITTQVVSDLRRAQQYAQASYRPCGGTFENVAFSVTSSSSYSIIANCSATSTSIKNINIDSNYEITSTGIVLFLPLAKGVASQRTIQVTSLITSESRQITVNASGDVIY